MTPPKPLSNIAEYSPEFSATRVPTVRLKVKGGNPLQGLGDCVYLNFLGSAEPAKLHSTEGQGSELTTALIVRSLVPGLATSSVPTTRSVTAMGLDDVRGKTEG